MQEILLLFSLEVLMKHSDNYMATAFCFCFSTHITHGKKNGVEK